MRSSNPIRGFSYKCVACHARAYLIVVLSLASTLPVSFGDDSARPSPNAQSQPLRNTSISFHAPANRTLKGKCQKARDRSPVPGARVVLYELTGLAEKVRRIAETQTNEEGDFEFQDLRPVSWNRFDRRRYGLIAFAEGMPHSFFNLIYNNHELDRTQFLTLHEGMLRVPGKVVDEKGSPISGVLVHRNHAPSPLNLGTTMTRTNDEGLFVINELPIVGTQKGGARNVNIVIRHEGYETRYINHQSTKFQTYTLKRYDCEITGLVLDANTDQPVPRAVVSAVKSDSDAQAKGDITVTDDSGRYILRVPPGKYKVMLDDDMRFVAEAQIQVCRKRGMVYEMKPILAQAGGWIVGRVFDTETNKPIVFVPSSPQLRVAVGLFGPNRPKGRLIYTDNLAEVDDQGRFRMRAMPGENFPYLCNMRGSRNTFTTMKQPAIRVQAGEETTCDLSYTPELTSEQKMKKARDLLTNLPKGEKRVEAILAELRKLNSTIDECEIWCLLVQELTNIGPSAVPELCRELESTDQQRMYRRLAFALRAIGDPRAVPSLIRVLPKTLLPSMSDYGLRVEDPELARFMAKHDIDEKDRGVYFSFGRPMREFEHTLEKLTGHQIRQFNLPSMSRSKDLRALARQEKAFHQAAQAWAKWWESEWKQFDVPGNYNKVELPAFKERDLTDYPSGLEITKNATTTGGLSGMTLTPIGDDDKTASFFLDLDTGRRASWPEELPDSQDTDNLKRIQRWAADRGYDLICLKPNPASLPNVNGTMQHILVGVYLKKWEIDLVDAKNIDDLLSRGELPKHRPVEASYLWHEDKEGKRYSKIGASFLYLTRDEGLGIIRITDDVLQAKDITGAFSSPKGVGFYRGVRFDYQPIAR